MVSKSAFISVISANKHSLGSLEDSDLMNLGVCLQLGLPHMLRITESIGAIVIDVHSPDSP